MQMNKESYERSTLIVTEFDQEDVITTSNENPLFGLFRGDNETRIVPNK